MKKKNRKNKEEKDLIKEEIREIEKLVYERRKFLKKLVYVILLIAILFLISHLFLRVK